MSMSAHEPKSAYDNTKTERTRNSLKIKINKHSPGHVSVRNHN